MSLSDMGSITSNLLPLLFTITCYMLILLLLLLLKKFWTITITITGAHITITITITYTLHKNNEQNERSSKLVSSHTTNCYSCAVVVTISLAGALLVANI